MYNNPTEWREAVEKCLNPPQGGWSFKPVMRNLLKTLESQHLQLTRLQSEREDLIDMWNRFKKIVDGSNS